MFTEEFLIQKYKTENKSPLESHHPQMATVTILKLLYFSVFFSFQIGALLPLISDSYGFPNNIRETPEYRELGISVQKSL